MKRKRLDRDIWWDYNEYNYPPYYQMRVDTEEFHGMVCLIKLNEGECHYWDLPVAGKTAVIGEGMTWLQLIPDGKNHLVTAMYLPDNTVSVWYVDVIEGIEYDIDGVAVYIDKYLDVIFTPHGDLIIDDRDELDEALQSGDLSIEQYDSALKECDLIINELCSDVAATETFCNRILSYVNSRINNGEKQFITQYAMSYDH